MYRTSQEEKKIDSLHELRQECAPEGKDERQEQKEDSQDLIEGLVETKLQIVPCFYSK